MVVVTIDGTRRQWGTYPFLIRASDPRLPRSGKGTPNKGQLEIIIFYYNEVCIIYIVHNHFHILIN